MPNLDAETLFSNQQTIAAVASTIVSTNAIDMGATGTDVLGNSIASDLGRSSAEVLIQVTEAVVSTGAATVQFQLITSAAANLGSPTVISETPAIAKATLVPGYKARIAIPHGLTARYLGMQYVIGTETTTAGKVTAGIVGAFPSARI